MKIRKFNEEYIQAIDRIWVVIETEGSDYYIHHVFSSEILAADFLIKYVNSEFDQDFEPYFDIDDGSRFFLNLSDNEDYERCKKYLFDNKAISDIFLSILSYPIITSSKIRAKTMRFKKDFE